MPKIDIKLSDLPLQKPDVIAKLFGVSVRRVQQLTQEGIIRTTTAPDNKYKRYDLEQTITDYIKYLSDKAYGREQSDKELVLKDEKMKAEIALKQSQLELHQLKTDIAKGNYIPVDDVKIDYQRFFLLFKKFATAIPSRVGGQIAGYVDPVVERGVERDLQLEINNMLRSFIVAGNTPPEEGGKN